jgi:zinc transporter ZupT
VEQLSTFKKMASVLEHEKQHHDQDGDHHHDDEVLQEYEVDLVSDNGDEGGDDSGHGRSPSTAPSVAMSSTGGSSLASSDDISTGDIEDQQSSLPPPSPSPIVGNGPRCVSTTKDLLFHDGADIGGDDDFIDNIPLDAKGRPIIEVGAEKQGSSSSSQASITTKKKRNQSSSKPRSQMKKKTTTKTGGGDDDDPTIDADILDGSYTSSEGNNNNGKTASKEVEDTTKLADVGYKTAVAIALHNFPEGLATFVAALDDPRIGAVLALAIAIHNIPEGLCVSLPIYYATGIRWKGFMWGVLSGFSEILAAFVGWLILASAFTPTTYAILFGIVAGKESWRCIPNRLTLENVFFSCPICTCTGRQQYCVCINMIVLLPLFSPTNSQF